MTALTIRDPKHFLAAYRAAVEYGQREEFCSSFLSLIGFVCEFIPDEPPDDTARTVAEVVPDWVPHSFYAYASDTLKAGGHRLRANAGMIRHRSEVDGAERYSWSVHT